MAKENFEKLIVRYADSRQICNCGEAYYTNSGQAYIDGQLVNNFPVCEGGCSSAQIAAKHYIAQRVAEELSL